MTLGKTQTWLDLSNFLSRCYLITNPSIFSSNFIDNNIYFSSMEKIFQSQKEGSDYSLDENKH